MEGQPQGDPLGPDYGVRGDLGAEPGGVGSRGKAFAVPQAEGEGGGPVAGNLGGLHLQEGSGLVQGGGLYLEADRLEGSSGLEADVPPNLLRGPQVAEVQGGGRYEDFVEGGHLVGGGFQDPGVGQALEGVRHFFRGGDAQTDVEEPVVGAPNHLVLPGHLLHGERPGIVVLSVGENVDAHRLVGSAVLLHLPENLEEGSVEVGLGALGLEAVDVPQEVPFFLGKRKSAGRSRASVKGLEGYPALMGKPFYKLLELCLDLGEDDPAFTVSQPHHGARGVQDKNVVKPFRRGAG